MNLIVDCKSLIVISANMSLVKAISTIGGFTLISRIFGFLRDILVAKFLGAGMLADAFFVAFKLPNFLRRLFAEGAFNAAFVPLFAGKMAADGKESAQKFAEEILAMLMAILLLLVAIAEIFMPWLLLLFAPGFADNTEKFMLTILLARLTFPYILFISLVTLLGGILNSVNRFAAVAATPILLNITLIISLLLLTPIMPSSAHALATGVAIAGIIQFTWLAFICHRLKLLPKLQLPKFTPSVKKLLNLAAPAAFGAGVAQINLLIDIVLASLFAGAVSWLYYADRLNELPIGVVGVAIGTALLPMLSKTIRQGNDNLAISQLNKALALAAILTIPATIALIVISTPLITTIYQYGAFRPDDTKAVVPALIAYAVGLPAFIMIKIFSPCFFAREDTKTPVKIALLCVAINISCNIVLMQYYQHVGLAMATTISGWTNALLMAFVLYRRKYFQPNKQLSLTLIRVVVSGLIMALILYFLQHNLPWQQITERALSLAILVTSGAVTYFIIAWLTGIRPKHL